MWLTTDLVYQANECNNKLIGYPLEMGPTIGQVLCYQAGTTEKMLGAHLMNEDDFWGNTNPTDVSIDTSHITEFHTHKHTKKQLQLSY